MCFRQMKTHPEINQMLKNKINMNYVRKCCVANQISQKICDDDYRRLQTCFFLE